MNKKSVIVLVLIVLIGMPVNAVADSIYEYLQTIDDQYYLVVGVNGKGGDTLAAADVAIGIRKYNPSNINIEPVVENEINPSSNKILIGSPCGNSLVPILCAEWPYKAGEAIIAIMGNDLVIAGTTTTDTRRAAKVIAEYPKYAILKTTTSVVVLGSGLIPSLQNVEETKTKEQLICGDLICEPGESTSCFIDCAQLTCFDICLQEGFRTAMCREEKTNPNVPSCLVEELNKGAGFCASGKVCCCEKEEEQTTNGIAGNKEENAIPEQEAEETSAVNYMVVSFLVVLIILAAAGIVLLFKKHK